MVKLLFDMKRYLFTLLLSVLTLNVALAEATFTTIPPRQVIAGNKFNITFRLKDGEGSNITAPEIQGCTLLYGPSTSTMQSYQNINGRTTSSKTIDFSYVYRADTPGTYTIGEATINVDGKTLRTSEVQFKVLPADKASQSNVKVDDYSTHTSDKQVSKDDVFVRIILSKSKAYEQEAIDCTIK